MDRLHVIGAKPYRRRLAVAVAAGLALASLISPAWPQAGPPPRLEAEKPAPPANQSAPATKPASRPVHAPLNARIVEDGWFAPVQPKSPPPALPQPIERAFIIPIRDEITPTMAEAMKRKVSTCRGKGAQLVILDMHTPGGQVGAALDIVNLIKQDLADIYTVCYVRTWAISAGAMIAMACNEIVVTPDAKIGDCAPIVMGGKLEGIEREKIETVLRKEFESSAERSGYNVPLSRAMVSIQEEVWLVRHKQTQELRYVDADEWRSRVDVPPGLATAPANPKAEWELLKVVDKTNQLLTMTASDALRFGFARYDVPAPYGRPYAELISHYHIANPPTVLADTWSEELVGFLTSPTVTAILLAIVMLGVYMEFQAPGFGLAGTVAVIALALLLGSRYLIGLAVWWEIALFVLGLGLILVEVFLTPTFGALLVVGILMCLAALVGIIVDNPPDKLPIPDTELGWEIFSSGLMALGIGFLAAIAAIIVVAKYLPRIPVAGRLVLTPPPPDAAQPAPVEPASPLLAVEVGDVGDVTSICRPVGQIRIGDKLVDAETEGEFLQAGTKVRVIKKEGNRIVIQQLGTRD